MAQVQYSMCCTWITAILERVLFFCVLSSSDPAVSETVMQIEVNLMKQKVACTFFLVIQSCELT